MSGPAVANLAELARFPVAWHGAERIGAPRVVEGPFAGDPVMSKPAIKKRGGDPDIKPKPNSEKPADPAERALEEGLEESMAGSDPVSITQPSKSRVDKKQEEKTAAKR
jgi:hypothetical protein